jgi:curved DNA-binding protein CbpA
MPRNPFTVLGLPPDATTETIRSTWRGLARQHHPDIASGDPVREKRSTRTMAEINAAYQELRDPVKRRVHREAAVRAARAGGVGGRRGAGAPAGGAGGPSGPGATAGTGGGDDESAARPAWPRPYPTRPVTARIDTSALFRPRNAVLRPLDRSPLPGLPPRPRSVEGREPPRASSPSGPALRRRGPTLESDLPTLAAALGTRLRFGKFSGLTLGEVALVEPSYIDWIVRTIARDPEIGLAARVVLRHLATGPARRPRLDTLVQRG